MAAGAIVAAYVATRRHQRSRRTSLGSRVRGNDEVFESHLLENDEVSVSDSRGRGTDEVFVSNSRRRGNDEAPVSDSRRRGNDEASVSASRGRGNDGDRGRGNDDARVPGATR
jgi:hypothetical protein